MDRPDDDDDDVEATSLLEHHCAGIKHSHWDDIRSAESVIETEAQSEFAVLSGRICPSCHSGREVDARTTTRRLQSLLTLFELQLRVELQSEEVRWQTNAQLNSCTIDENWFTHQQLVNSTKETFDLANGTQ